jgi:hypothetical protein
VLAAAEQGRSACLHVDRTAEPFVTLDPASSTDLDQAFTIARSGADLVLRYAIADVAWFVEDGDPVDEEAWRRGETLTCPMARPASIRGWPKRRPACCPRGHARPWSSPFASRRMARHGWTGWSAR